MVFSKTAHSATALELYFMEFHKITFMTLACNMQARQYGQCSIICREGVRGIATAAPKYQNLLN